MGTIRILYEHSFTNITILICEVDIFYKIISLCSYIVHTELHPQVKQDAFDFTYMPVCT
jgi:hypothetical protein